MIHRQRRTRSAWLLLGVILCLVVGTFGPTTARTQSQAASGELLETTVVMEGLPPITAPGAAVPLHWVTSGGVWVENTAVWWDTSGHAYDNNYRYRTGFQKNRPAGAFFDYIDVPLGIGAIYLKPWAVIDSTETWAPRQYSVPTWRAMDVGSSNAKQDAQGRWWDADADMVRRWVGLSGGTQRYVNQPIGDTDMGWLYQRQRVGIESFGCWLTEAVSAMNIEVSFHLAELEVITSGARVFDIVLEPGTTEEVTISNVDIAAQAGLYNALVLTRTVTVRDHQLDIAFRSVVGQPVLNGISLKGVNGYPQREASQRVAYSEHDTYVVGGSNNWTADTLLLGGQDYHHGGLLFFELQVPAGAQINNAELWVTAADTHYQALNLTIYADDVDSSTNFRTGSSVPLRPRTSARVHWNVTETWIDGRTYTSPDLADVIQEVIDRPGWRNRNALTLLLIAEAPAQAGLPPRAIWSMDGDYASRAQLNISYTPGDQAEAPTPAPTLTFTPTPSRTPTPTVTPTATATATAMPRIYLPWLMMEAPKAN